MDFTKLRCGIVNLLHQLEFSLVWLYQRTEKRLHIHMVFWVKKCMERDGFCRSVTSNLNYFFPRDTKGQEKKIVRALATDSRLESSVFLSWNLVLFRNNIVATLDRKRWRFEQIDELDDGELDQSRRHGGFLGA